MEKGNLILIVEDNENDYELMAAAFEEFHLANRIIRLKDGEEALQFLRYEGPFQERRRENPVVILLDLKMPKVDGMEVLEEVRRNEHLKMIPIVILTSSSEEADLLKSYRLGANGYVVKPLDFKGFIETIKQLGVFWILVNNPPPN